MLRQIRLLPAVIVLGGTLLLVKAVGLVRDAQAQTSPTASAADPVQPISVSKSTADDGMESSSSEVDVLTSLSRRRAELDARDRQLSTQQDMIAAAEKRVDDKIASLKSLQSQIQALLVERDAEQQKEVDTLVKTYSSMKPRDAARIFNALEQDVLIAVASRMKPDVLAPILALMQSEPAQKLTLQLADRLKLPDSSSAPAPAVQTASTNAVSAQPVAPGTAATPPAAPVSAPAAAAPTTKTAEAAAPAPSASGK